MIDILADSGTVVVGNTTWELVQAFSKAMDDQAARNQSLLLPVIILILLLLGFYAYRSRTRQDKPDGREYTAYELASINPPASSQPKKDQKRDWVRVAVNLNLSYALVKTGLPDEKYEYRGAQSNDLSGGGLSLTTNQEIKNGDMLKIKLELDPGKELNITGRVARVVKDPSAEVQRWTAGVEFMGLASRDTEYIVQWIFRNQRDLITKS